MTIILFIIILAALVFVHELGHFISAKLFGIRVDEFAIGFPPRLFGFTRGETKYSVNLIPFGGYVKIFGENPDDDSISGTDSSRSFVNAKKWKQIVVLLSGILMNIIFAWILISISLNIGLVSALNDQYREHAQNIHVEIDSVLKNSPAELAGLKAGDVIQKINNNTIDNADQVQEIISQSISGITMEYERDHATKTVRIIPKESEMKKVIGISMTEVGVVKFSFPRSLWEGAKLTVIETENIAYGIYTFILSLFKGETGLLSQVTGPIGIAGMVGEASRLGASYLLGFIALISINLAVLNFVPFPALDGGRALFVMIEVVIRRKIKPAILNWTNGIGFAILIGLMIFVTYKDIAKLIH